MKESAAVLVSAAKLILVMDPSIVAILATPFFKQNQGERV